MLLPRPASRDCGDRWAVTRAGWGFVSDLGYLVSVRAGWRPARVVVWRLVAIVGLVPVPVRVLGGMVGLALAIAVGCRRLGAAARPSLGECKTGERSQQRRGDGNGRRAFPTVTLQPILH